MKSPLLLLAPLFLASPALTQSVVVLDQPPNQGLITYSDEDCNTCGWLSTGEQSIAENFVVNVDPGSQYFSLEEVVLWGGIEGTPVPADLFTINVYTDWANTGPSVLIYSEGDVAHTAVPTGGNIFSTVEIEYTFALAVPPQLASGTYWLEVYNDTTGSDSTWGIESGTLDAYGGIDGFAFSQVCPGSAWTLDGYAGGSPYRNFAMRISGSGALPSGPIQPFCFGDACPCGNDDGAGGCANSTGLGARLDFSGSASIGQSDLQLIGSNLLPGQSALLFSGTTRLNGGVGLLFGDGLRCAGQGVRRIAIQVPDASGHASWSGLLAGTHGWAPGEKTVLQVWYSDPTGSSCASGFNLTNAVEVLWQP